MSENTFSGMLFKSSFVSVIFDNVTNGKDYTTILYDSAPKVFIIRDKEVTYEFNS